MQSTVRFAFFVAHIKYVYITYEPQLLRRYVHRIAGVKFKTKVYDDTYI